MRNILRIIAAFICAILGGMVIGILFTPLKIWLVPTDLPRGLYSEPELIFLLVISIFAYLWAGFIIAKIVKAKKLLVAMSYSIWAALSWFLNDITFPIWYVLSQVVISFPFIFIGAQLHMKKANKRLKAMDGAERRPLA